MSYPHLFSNGRLGRITTKNRIVMSPMDENMANADGSVSDQTIAYYEERAKGGAGIIMTGAVSIDYPRSKAVSSQQRLDNIKFVKGWERLARAVHRYGALLIPQIHHAGANTDMDTTEGVVPFKVSDVGPENYITLTKEDIKMLQDKYISAARYAQMAGCDGVEVHGYLMMQFITTTINHRTDEYGGSLENRSRFAKEIIEGIRKACGPNFIIGTKVQVHTCETDTLSDEDSIKLARIYEKAGCDYLHAVPGITPKTTDLIESQYYEQGDRVVLAEKIKANVKIPVYAVGLLREPEFCEKVLADGKADFIVLGRALLADPYWPEKAKQGKSDEIRKCISCLDACYGNIVEGRPIRCVLNPEVGCECELKNEPLPAQSKNLAIIGGGLSGMQAAITAAKRGHKVTLFEEKDKLGGQVNYACVPPHKEYLKWALEWFSAEVKRQGVDVRTSCKADAKLVKELHPDIVFVATGARPWNPNIEGIESGVQAWDVLSGQVRRPENSNITVIGAGSIGCETSLYLAEKGNKITILEMAGDFAGGLQADNKAEMKQEMDESGIDLILNAAVQKISPDGVTYKAKDGSVQKTDADMIVLCMGQRSYGQELIDELKKADIEVDIIGDARKASKIVNATTTGFYAALNL